MRQALAMGASVCIPLAAFSTLEPWRRAGLLSLGIFCAFWALDVMLARR